VDHAKLDQAANLVGGRIGVSVQRTPGGALATLVALDDLLTADFAQSLPQLRAKVFSTQTQVYQPQFIEP